MPEVALVWKLAGAIWGVVTLGVGWWVNDLKAKQTRATARTDKALDKINNNSDRITRLESETITEAESIRLMSEMERRVMDNFKEFRYEFKNDLTKFRDDLREDLKAYKQKD